MLTVLKRQVISSMLLRLAFHSVLNLLVIICLILQLVNRAHESLETNARVQECLVTAKQAKKLVVRYTQVTTLPSYLWSTNYHPAGRKRRADWYID